jgi:hypothetical protein
MPIKSFTFAFKLDAKDLLAYVVERNLAVDIHATGQPRAAQQAQELLPAASEPLALPAPGSKPVAIDTVMAFFVAHPKKSITTSMVRALLIETGHSKNTSHGLVFTLKAKGLIKRTAPATYRVTAKGLREAGL